MVRAAAAQDQFVFENMTLDLGTYDLFVNDEAVDLTFYEFEILRRFCQEPDRIIDYDTICLAVWKDVGLTYKRRLAVAICRIRAKLTDVNGYRLETVRGRGYGFLRRKERGATHA